ncbi:MAG: sigma-70 family RNA polymerase sigma factor [Phycisphaeraceae bacterium]|nr:sigma-70 family RNA polymerase sigma factor [Phycisphaeraceae bacterium]
MIRHFTRKLSGQPAVAEELAQQTWIAFWQALTQGKYDPSKSRPSTFLYAVSGNIWLRHLRAIGRTRPEQRLNDREHGSGAGVIAGSQSDDPADAASEASAIELVRRALQGHEPSSGLSDDERLILKAIAAGRTDRELAAELGVAPSTAHARKKVATEKLRVFLESRGVSDKHSERTGHEDANK